VGIEMAGEIAVTQPGQRVTLVHSRDHLLSNESLPDDVKDITLKALKETGVDVILEKRVLSVAASEIGGKKLYKLELSDGSQLTASHVIWALSKSVPSTAYLPENVLDEGGLVRITPRLVSISRFNDTEITAY
jgi:pyruvate/2-oxoglutarate dehydrogenase complex dihydrolipoamide dehydrogenase (E3) component